MTESTANTPIPEALAALLADVQRGCLPALARVTGTHALVLDAMELSAYREEMPRIAGLGRWTQLHVEPDGRLSGPLRAETGELPFVDGSFSAVLVRFAAGCGSLPERLASETARVLAPHGLLLVVELHPHSGWRPWLRSQRHRNDTVPGVAAPARWRRSLRACGLAIRATRRCGAPWPRAGGVQGLPAWIRGYGGAYLIEACKHGNAGVVQRLQPLRSRGVVEHSPWASGAHRTRAIGG